VPPPVMSRLIFAHLCLVRSLRSEIASTRHPVIVGFCQEHLIDSVVDVDNHEADLRNLVARNYLRFLKRRGNGSEGAIPKKYLINWIGSK